MLGACILVVFLLINRFKHCTDDVKTRLFHSHCSSLYGGVLWCKYTKAKHKTAKIAYNDIYRGLNNKTDGPQSPTALEFTFTSAEGEGDKNRWAPTGCHWDFNICTYNARSLSSDDRMIELEEEILRIMWNIIGLSEVCRKGKGSIILNNTGHTLYYSGSDEQRHGVGFMVNKNIAHNVISYRGLSDRLAELTVHIN